MPEHSPIINVRVDTCGDHSWNTAYGAYTVPVPIPYGKCVDLSIIERFFIQGPPYILECFFSFYHLSKKNYKTNDVSIESPNIKLFESGKKLCVAVASA